MSIPKPPYAEGQEFTNDVTGVTYRFDGVKWIASSSGEEIDLSGYVRKVGGDSMQGPLNVQVQPNTGSRETNRVQTLGVFTNSESSALRLGTNRDRVYIGDNDTAFNGPVKVDELKDKNGNGVNYQGKTSGPNNIQNRKSVLDITDPIQGDVEQNTQDIISLFQEIAALSKPLAGGKYSGISIQSVNYGQFHLNTGSYATAGQVQLTFHELDEDGASRSWGDLDPGDYIFLQSRQSENYGIYEAINITKAGDRYVIVADHVEGRGNHVGPTLVKIYNLAGSDLELTELDQRYLRKNVQQTTTGLLKFQMSSGMCLQAHNDAWQIWNDGTFTTARTTFNANHLVTQNYVSTNFASKSHDHAGVYSPVGHTHDFSVSDATHTTKGIAFLGQAVTGTSTAPSLKSGQLYWNTNNKTLYVGN